jgi:hypothetical protein
MKRGSPRRPAFQALLDRFPGRSQAICRAALRDQGFRALCDDLLLAIAALERFEQRPDAALRPEIPDYRILIAEMEAELLAHLAAQGHP